MASLQQKRYSDKEYHNLYMYAMQANNLEAAIEIEQHRRFFGQHVEVIKGRKVPIGTKGEIVYLARKHYGQNQWFGYETYVGIVDENGTTHYTNINNIRKS
nr:MAG TPA: hypothetical protein [Caudoviricetes sp.]